jgi:outer membrane protein assembly factor BamB
MKMRILVVLILFVHAINGSVVRADWPEFRGPSSDGYVTKEASKEVPKLPLTWSESENVRWTTPIPGLGWSTPVVMDGKIWLTTATEDGHDFSFLCVDAATGKVVHNKKLFHCDSPEPLGNNVNCYAAPSPAIEPGRFYAHFGSYGTACIDTATGNVLWQRDDLKCRHYRGPSSSVVLFDNLVILTFDGVDLQYTVALDKQTGKNVWKTDRDVQWNDQDVTGKGAEEAKRMLDGDHRKAHSTPVLFTAADGRQQLLSVGAMAAFAYDPQNGHDLWRVNFNDFSAAARPLYRDGVAYLVTGGPYAQLWAVGTDGTGNVTDTHVRWRLNSRVARTASPTLIDGLIYMVSDDGIINCIDAATGQPVWSHRVGGRFAASPIYVGGSEPRIYLCDQDGKTTVIKPGRKYEELAANTLDEGCMASPAVDGSALILRTRTHLYRIENVAKVGQ